MLFDNKRKLTNEEIRKAILSGFRYIIVNLATSGLVLAMLFLIAVIIGFESDAGVKFFNSHMLHTVMMPLIVWYFGYVAYNEGYKHSVAEKYDKRKILIPALMVFAVQIAVVLFAVDEAASHIEEGFFTTASTFLMCPYRIFFDNFADFMPVIMILPTPVASAAMYIGYDLSRKKEIEDHMIKEDSRNFRDMLEDQQYNKKNSDGEDKWH